jgi:predicted amino acid racemase
MCRDHGLGVWAVTKGFCADPVIAQAYLDAGLTSLADSRVRNLAGLSALPAEKWLLRPPMPSEVSQVVQVCDGSLNSEPASVEKLSAAAQAAGKIHRVVFMADLGDIREGYVDHDQLLRDAAAAQRLPGIEVAGLGTNLTCYSFVQSTPEKMTRLGDLADRLADAVEHPLSVVSGGNSATLALMLEGGIDPRINNLRLGESLLLGRERAGYSYLPGTRNDAFVLQVEVIELKTKPSVPDGVIGADSYGNRREFSDRGPRLMAICAAGRQDLDPQVSWPVNPAMTIMGASSDHLMIDVTDAAQEVAVGSAIDLVLGYFSMMRAFTSPYVSRSYQ